MIKYRYARGSDQSIVDVYRMARDERHKYAPYICFGCGSELVPNLGTKKIKHFSHKTAGTCSRETYLHELAKDAFFRTYTKCLDEKKAFIFESSFPATCNKFYAEIGETCSINKIIDIDLTKHFKNIYLEKGYEGFIPDILLTSEDELEVLFIEIAVSHKCEDQKIKLGKRIIEINICNEDDITPILEGHIFEPFANITTYNFKKREIIGDICKGECERKVYLFIVYKSKKSILFELSPLKAINREIRGKVKYSEILGFSTDHEGQHTQIYKNKVRELHFKKTPIKNCYICRYHGADGVDNAIFCKFRKESVGSNEAVDCEYYRTFRNIIECDVADKNNEEYAKNNQRKLLRIAFSRLLNRNLP